MRYLLAIASLALAGCDQVGSLTADAPEPEDSYQSCLASAVSGSHTLSADDIRSLCREAYPQATPFYKWAESGLVPGDKFTECYDREVKSADTADEKELAILVCQYANNE